MLVFSAQNTVRSEVQRHITIRAAEKKKKQKKADDPSETGKVTVEGRTNFVNTVLTKPGEPVATTVDTGLDDMDGEPTVASTPQVTFNVCELSELLFESMELLSKRKKTDCKSCPLSETCARTEQLFFLWKPFSHQLYNCRFCFHRESRLFFGLPPVFPALTQKNFADTPSAETKAS